MTLSETAVSEVIRELGLPENTKYLGYVVHLPQKDEFLAYTKETRVITERVFSKTPDAAKVYTSYDIALREAKACNQHAEPWLLFDVGNQYYVAPVE